MKKIETNVDIMVYLDELRDQKDFNTIKEVRDYCRYLVAVCNTEWFKYEKPEPDGNK